MTIEILISAICVLVAFIVIFIIELLLYFGLKMYLKVKEYENKSRFMDAQTNLMNSKSKGVYSYGRKS